MTSNATKSAYSPRSDLAVECVELSFGKHVTDKDGITTKREKIDGFTCDTVEVKTEKGAQKLGKPIGVYITVDIGKIWLYGKDDFKKVCLICAKMLSEILPKNYKDGGSCLLAALGNKKITADSQGPLCAESFIVSRHIKRQNPALFSSLELYETMCVTPGVLASSGVESATVVKAVAEKTKPSFIIAADSLAARKTERIAATLQISNSGITPGSGVGNHREAINSSTMGVPVISIGIPTVVDALTVCSDVLEEYIKRNETQVLPQERETLKAVLSSVSENGSNGFFLTPKNADVISQNSARLIAMTINKALNPTLSFEDMEELI